MKSAKVLVKCLENEGVEYIFGIPGEENIGVMDALLDSSIEFIVTRHEQGAAFMADVYGRLTGKAGVCMSTLGPGATNLVTGVADGNMDRAPMVEIAGQGATPRMHKESHQVLDLVNLFEPITKYSTQIREPEIVPEVIRKAFKFAQAEKPGASFIDFPENVAETEVEDITPLMVQSPLAPQAPKGKCSEVAMMISKAKNPIIIAGNGVIRHNASEALVSFAENINAPVATTFMAKGVMPSSHPLSVGTVGLKAHDLVAFGIDESDLVICVGYDLVEYDPGHWNPQHDKPIIHIDGSPAEVDRNYIVAAPEDIVISDVGAHKMWMARMYQAERPNTCIISNGFASMGIALPGAIAAKLVHPDRNVVAVSGDGGFMMNNQEIETAVRLGLNITILMFNDNKLGLIEWHQLREYGRKSNIDVGNPDFVKFADSFGANGYKVDKTEDLPSILQTALNDGSVSLIDCPVDYSENMKLTERLKAMKSLED